MITDLIISILLVVPIAVLNTLPNLDINISFNDTVFEAFKDMVSCINYVLPLEILFICLTVKLAVRFWALPYAIVLRIKSFIPSMGH